MSFTVFVLDDNYLYESFILNLLLQKVYWSDVHERSIHVSNLDGSEHRLFLTSNNSLGIVDGMAVDIKGENEVVVFCF